ncbi:MAG: Gfo/Idh/MocA family protein, partial [Candidatus Kapaibacteriota bacterium]
SANALSVAKHFGFKYFTTDSLSIIKNPEIDIVFIATRHDTHSQYVLECIKSGKPVFVEKPLCIKIEELEEISSAYQRSPVPIMVGFNRRFAEPIQYLKKIIGNRTQPLAMHYRINAGTIPPDHWIQNPEIGGGRIVGEVCHFIDTMMFLADSEPISVFADAISHNISNSTIQDTVAITIKFRDGSLGVIEYFANGSKKLEKEYLEIYWENNTAVLKNFEKLSIYKYRNIEQKKFDGSKGHKEEINVAIKYFQSGKSPIDFFGIYIVTLSTFAIIESLRRGEKVLISEMSKQNIGGVI